MAKLKYKQLQEKHANYLLPLWTNENVIRYTNIAKPCTIDEIKEKVNILSEHDVFIIIGEDNDVVGLVGCPCINKENKEYGIFYHIIEKYWNKGIATCAASWVIEYMREKHSNLTLYADVCEENIASDKILKKLGFFLIDSNENSLCKKIDMKVKNYKLQLH